MIQYYSLCEIAIWYGRPVTTTWRHIKHLTAEKKFTKKSIGRYFTKEETEQLSLLMNFKIETRTKRKAA